jgi:hypothetical protein
LVAIRRWPASRNASRRTAWATGSSVRAMVLQ